MSEPPSPVLAAEGPPRHGGTLAPVGAELMKPHGEPPSATATADWTAPRRGPSTPRAGAPAALTAPHRPPPGPLGIQPAKRMLVDGGFTLDQVGHATGVSAPQLSRVLNGHARPSPLLANAVACLLGAPVEHCFTPLARTVPVPPDRSPPAGRFGVQPIRTSMLELGLSARAVAAALGCSVAYVSSVVNGRQRPSLPAAARMAGLVAQSIEQAFGLSDVRPAGRSLAESAYGPQPLATLLVEAGISFQEAVRHLGLSARVVDLTVSGDVRPSLEHALAMSHLVGHPLTDCFTDAVLGLSGPLRTWAKGTARRMEQRGVHPARPGPLGVQPIKAILLDRGITHGDAARVIGCTQQHVTASVNGQTPLSLVVATRLARLVAQPIEVCFVAGGTAVRAPLAAARFGPQPLRALLGAAGMRVPEAARRCRLTGSLVQGVLLGEVRPSLEQAVLLARLVHAPVASCYNEQMLGTGERFPALVP